MLKSGSAVPKSVVTLASGRRGLAARRYLLAPADARGESLLLEVMMGDNPITLPDFIPREVLDEHLEPARRSVAASYGGHTRIQRWKEALRGVMLAVNTRCAPVALVLAVLASFFVLVLWAGLAMMTGETIWWGFAAGAALSIVLTAIPASSVLTGPKRAARTR